ELKKMSAANNKFQQLQKFIIKKNITCYDYTRFRIIELIKSEKFTKEYRAVFKNKITAILKSFENSELTINEELKIYHRLGRNGGTLGSYLHENSQHFSLDEMIKFSLQIANAVRYLHAKEMVNLGLLSITENVVCLIDEYIKIYKGINFFDEFI
ncbi:44381_t:CDS:2, partial [Gigaspora margarita]